MPRCYFARTACYTMPALDPLSGHAAHRKACWADVTSPDDQAYAERRRRKKEEAQKALLEGMTDSAISPAV